MARVVIAGVCAGVLVFFWGAVSHMLPPLGSMGIHGLPNEDAVVGPIGEHALEPGLYFFPWRDMNKSLSDEEIKAWTAKAEKGPVGLMVIRAKGAVDITVSQLLRQLGFEIVAALIAACVVSHIQAGFAKRVLVVLAFAAFAFVSVSLPHWNWYGFPTDFTIAAAIDELVGWLLGGLVIAAIVRPTTPKAAGA